MSDMMMRFTAPALAALWCTAALAQDAAPPAKSAPTKSAWDVSIGMGAAYAPDYQGSDDYKVKPLPDLSISYRDVVFLRGPSLGANVITIVGHNGRDKIQIGPIARYGFGRDQDDNDALRGLGNVDPSVEIGGFVRYGVGAVFAEVTAVQDVADGHQGLLIEPALGCKIPVSDKMRMTFRTTASWANDHYMQSFFGISAEQSATSGRTAYDAKAGFKDVGLSAGLDYSLTDHWGIGGRVGYNRLLGDAADSPLVKDDGAANQLSGSAALRYKF